MSQFLVGNIVMALVVLPLVVFYSTTIPIIGIVLEYTTTSYRPDNYCPHEARV